MASSEQNPEKTFMLKFARQIWIDFNYELYERYYTGFIEMSARFSYRKILRESLLFLRVFDFEENPYISVFEEKNILALFFLSGDSTVWIGIRFTLLLSFWYHDAPPGCGEIMENILGK